MKKFFRLGQHPSKTGERYYNTLFQKMDLPYTYTAVECENLKESIDELLKEGASGFSVTMPFKQEIRKFLVTEDMYVRQFQSCNTVLVKDGQLHGYNSDVCGAVYAKLSMPMKSSVAVLGDGAMGMMMYKMLNENCAVYSRKKENWHKRHDGRDVYVNCTTFGTSIPASPLDIIPENTKLIIDLAMPGTQLELQCSEAGVKYISGKEFYKNQFIEQFEIFTGIKITEEEFNSI